MGFDQRPNATTTAKVVQDFVPRVGIKSEALTKMDIYVDECSDEVGWLGTARRMDDGEVIVIDDVFLFEQEVHSTTTEITPDGLSSFAEELMERGEEGIEIWNNLKVWGHSHVNMGISPSGQDDKQMETFKEGGHDWFIRLIANKKGNLKIDLYDYKTGVTYLDMKWVELPSDEEREIQEEIEKLELALLEYNELRDEEYRENIKKEMKDKVSKIVTNYAKTNYYYPQSNWARAQESKKKQKTQQEVGETKKVTHGTAKTGTKGTTTSYDSDQIVDDDDVLTFLSEFELVRLAYTCQTFWDLEEELELYGYAEFFTRNDLEAIFRMMYKIEMRGGMNNEYYGY